MNSRSLVIIPTYNESQNIEKLVREVLALPERFDILIIDDNSPDGTAEIARKAAKGNSRVSLITRPGKLGLGTAYREGFAWALEKRYDHVFTMDADLSHQPKYLSDLHHFLHSCDLAIGSRYIPGGGIEGWPLQRKLLSALGNAYARTVAGLPVRDCTSGFMGIRKELIEDFLSRITYSDGYSFLIELKNLAHTENYSIREFPILFIDRVAGKSKISRTIIFEAMLLGIKLRLKKLLSFGFRGNSAFKFVDRFIGIPLVFLLGLITSRGGVVPKRPKSILVIKLSAIGDTILLVPALRSLRKNYPDARIAALCTDINKAIFENCPYVDEVVLFDMKRIVTHPLSFLKPLRRGNADIALDFDQWLRVSALLAYFSGAGLRAGFMTPGQGKHFAFTHPVRHRRDKHEVECFLDILRTLGIDEKDTDLEFRLDAESVETAGRIMQSLGMDEGKPFIIFHPETPAHGAQRQWPVERYRQLAGELTKKYNCTILLTGTKKDMPSNKKLASAFSSDVFVLPPVTIREFAAVLSKSKLMVCGNTGVMHLACALNVPVIALHGPTDPVKWGPWGKNCAAVRSKLLCSPCLYLGFEYGCRSRKCMESISVQEVLGEIRNFLHFPA